jgi:hypothetical protein
MYNKYIYEDIVLFNSVVPVERKKTLYFIELLKNVVWLNQYNTIKKHNIFINIYIIHKNSERFYTTIIFSNWIANRLND